MGVKFVLSLAAVCLVLACAADGRHLSQQTRYLDDMEEVSTAGRRPHPDAMRSVSQKKPRVIAGAVALKKLVLLKFKKIVPVSLILLRSGDENEAELVPVYPTSEIPPNVEFIPTPNGISGHKDVQAIAIPSELHQQLQAEGLATPENIQALLQEVGEDNTSAATNANTSAAAHQAIAVVEQANNDEPLIVKDDDESQVLKVKSGSSTNTISNLRRLAAEDVIGGSRRPGLRTAAHTTVEEIPLYLYSAKDTPMHHSAARRPSIRRRYHA